MELKHITKVFILIISTWSLFTCSTGEKITGVDKKTGIINEEYDEQDNCKIVYQVWHKGLRKRVGGGSGPAFSKSGTPVTEGWVDNDTFRTTAIGTPRPGVTNKTARRTTAKEAAIIMAQKKVMEKFTGARLEGAAGAADYSSTGIAVAKEFSGIIRGKTRPAGKKDSAYKGTSPSKEEKPEADFTRRVQPGMSGLKAGFADDNKQFNYFIGFLRKFNRVKHYPIRVNERIFIRLKDNKGKSIPNALVKIYSGQKEVSHGKTCSDGSFLFFPSESRIKGYKFRAEISYNQRKQSVRFDRQGRRDITVVWEAGRSLPEKVPLDILFIFDTTGSMGEEIARLKKTIEIIHMNLSHMKARPKVRFGMVLYKDRRESYVTKVVPLTENMNSFRQSLNKVRASGGGDIPEDLQAALKDSITRIKWNRDGIRLAFIITDAPPHLDYGQKENYVWASRKAKELGIKLFSVGTGGLKVQGEYILRQISQYTSGKYIFLTYGEQGESEGGKAGSVSHHTGANYTTDKLETIIIRFAKEELQNLSDEKFEIEDEHFTAVKVDYEKKDKTLQKLFDRSIEQLSNYSSIRIKSKTPASIIPIFPSKKSLTLNAEYFTDRMIFSMNKSKIFTIVERKDLQKILKEHELQMSGLVEEGNAAKVGKFLGAEMIIMGKLYQKGGTYELFLKLVRVKTAEVLSATKARIDGKLGL